MLLVLSVAGRPRAAGSVSRFRRARGTHRCRPALAARKAVVRPARPGRPGATPLARRRVRLGPGASPVCFRRWHPAGRPRGRRGERAMVLPPDQTERFYTIWIALLHYVNDRQRLVAPFPPVWGEATLPTEDAFELRTALWADDALREGFVADNPARLAPADLALVASWRHRLEGDFIIERYLKPHTIFLSEGSPARAYGVLGLVSPVEEIVEAPLPVYVQAVLLPFEGRIIYDSLLAPYPIAFGPGIRRSLREAYRDAQEREGVITALSPPAPPPGLEAQRAAVRGRAGRVLTAFRKELLRAGLSPPTAEQHVATVAAFADDCLLRQTPPRGLDRKSVV